MTDKPFDRPDERYALGSSWYLDEAIFQRERKRVFARTWQYAGHVSRLASVGDYFTFSLLDESLFCVRCPDHEIRTFYNVCQHRGNRLVDDEQVSILRADNVSGWVPVFDDRHLADTGAGVHGCQDRSFGRPYVNIEATGKYDVDVLVLFSR